MDFKIIGVYEIKNVSDCNLIEIQIKDSKIPLDLLLVTQSLENIDKSSWQVPYNEYLLDLTGEKILSKEWENIQDEKLIGSFRIVFFFHFLNINKPLSTQFGDFDLPQITNVPDRLKNISYNNPD
ncbi:hypothetical protein [Leptospira meyeri]|uniref:hypothetical protein n=1 Tax=Leptospira meyeri TaxID=29508 RepID=UPI001083C8C2|nr:hypothetical protein [Leptospira meyeri]TGM61980.1 hypothetical protein EHQ93_11675 [Leptospira meyeri]